SRAGRSADSQAITVAVLWHRGDEDTHDHIVPLGVGPHHGRSAPTPANIAGRVPADGDQNDPRRALAVVDHVDAHAGRAGVLDEARAGNLGDVRGAVGDPAHI